MRHHAHVACEYSNDTETRFYEAGQYIGTCCTKCNLHYSFNKKNYRLPVYFHNGSPYDFIFIMKLITAMPGDLEVIPTTEDKEMQIEYNSIQFKDSLKLISSPLRSMWLRHLVVTSICTCTPNSNYASTTSLVTRSGVTSTSIC